MTDLDMTYTHYVADSKVVVFSLDGSMLGENESGNISADFARYLEQGYTRFVIDLTALKHINSTGLGVFITLMTRVRSHNGEMLLSNPAKNIFNLLSITKLNSIFGITDTVDTAIARLSN
ncbi:MAG: STAS domain-containing protein [Bacteroidia bacterium]|nr:STAS domain-containing protein [Bacteroidia bacterium]